ncbi:iron(3+)-hydroxamate-binding protein yxeB [Paenibacillus selenitireducens]|uniref:Iron(3+)-hydroxamate-binding protein yxeB n=1 Tax=Paenibacillus selenitireducens TaxID=1324314 RepID=A0A1T2X1C9_9BACL|nr:ABC transporter substrate-binding protein [Paenibacillus selenitireducens]OPA73526.1 iron(3+)-hydroxamate-binding protein yxeB [Paenibacillus selenitireducens]
MKKKKSFFIGTAIILLLSLMVTACGGNNTSSNAASETADKPSTTETSTSKETTPAAEFRDYKTDKGIVKIPTKPLRIVTDYYGGELLSVGANVVGVEPTAFDNPFIKDQLKDAADVGAPINAEKTLALNPDLIVVMYDDSYDALSKIAPTVHIPYGTATNIYDTVKLFGDLVGEPQKAEDFIAAFDKKAAEGREKLKGIVDPNATAGLYELTDKGELWIFGDNAGRGGQAVYKALGFKMPEKLSGNGQTTQLSLEVLPEYGADYMFLTTYDPEKKGDELKKLKESGVWRNVKAVKDNQIFYNDFDTFYRYDPIAITGQIDLFVDMLMKRSQENKK